MIRVSLSRNVALPRFSHSKINMILIKALEFLVFAFSLELGLAKRLVVLLQDMQSLVVAK